MLIDHPVDCALAFGIPVTKQQLQAAILEPDGKEYARLFRRSYAALELDELWEQYSRVVADAAIETATAVAARGTVVCRYTTLQDLSEMLEKRRIVSLVAHWKRGGFSEEILEKIPDWRAALQQTKGPASKALAIIATSILSDKRRPSALIADDLNELLRSSLLVPERAVAGVTWIAKDPEYVIETNWTALREECTDWALPASGVEFSDAIYSIEAITQLFKNGLCRTLDLRMCHSTVLGDRVKLTEPCTTVLMNRKPATPAIQLPIYTATIELLETGRYDFAGAANVMRQALMRNWK